jgi:hypothetical protein
VTVEIIIISFLDNAINHVYRNLNAIKHGQQSTVEAKFESLLLWEKEKNINKVILYTGDLLK